MKASTAALVVILAVVACTGRAEPRHEDEIFASVLQAEVRFLVGDPPDPALPVYCIAVNTGDAPQSAGKEVMKRMGKMAPRIVRSAQCEVEDDQVVEQPTGRRALLITVGPVEWVKSDEAEVDAVITERRGHTKRHRYKVAYESGRWVCLGQVMKMSPA